MKKNIFSVIAIVLGMGTASLDFGVSARADSVFHHAKATFTDAFDTTGLLILGVGTSATLFAFAMDSQMHDAWINQQRMNPDLANFGDNWGKGIPEAVIALGQLIFDSNNGVADAEGLLSSTVVTYGMKYSIGRQRPDSDTRTSFPSGHTQISFASATSLGGAYGWWVAVPAYSLGVITGLSRLADDAHWFSDIVAGATVGILFGRASFKHHLIVRPFSFSDGNHGYGLMVSWRF